jgi:6-phosphogluconate dehydrogenase
MDAKIAIFGLGKIGMQVAKRLQKNGFEVFGWNRSEGPRKEFEQFASSTGSGSSGGRAFAEISDVVGAMGGSQRIFWILLPHEVVGDFLKNQLGPYLKAGDIVIDGGNSFYKESVERAKELNQKGIIFYDCGTSGGVWGLEKGFALMVGGPKEQWQIIEPMMKALSSGENYGLVGQNGAGHFVKMVHNGIEYGVMEAIAEGYGVMNASPFNLDLAQVSKIYQKGSVVSSWLIDLTRNIFENEDIAGTSGLIQSTGEGEWTIKTAKELGVDVRVIEDAFKVRQESADPKNQQKFSNKIVALLRKQFGGHSITKK